MGGRFFIGMTVIGVLIIQSLTTGILLSGLPSQYTLIVKAAVVMVVLLVQAPKSRELAGKAWEKIGSRKVRGIPMKINERYYPLLATLAVLALLYGYGIAEHRAFSDTYVLGALLTDNAFLIITAVGMTFVILSGGIDLRWA